MLTFYERLTKLKEFGLTDYQARAYLALLELNVSTANQIPAISRVPRTKIYGIMRQLHDKGLVQIIPETPLKYRAVPFKQYLERRVGQLREEAEDLERSVDTLAESFQLQEHEPDEQGKFEMFYGRRNVRDKLKDMYFLCHHQTEYRLISYLMNVLTQANTCASPNLMKTGSSSQLSKGGCARLRDIVALRFTFLLL